MYAGNNLKVLSGQANPLSRRDSSRSSAPASAASSAFNGPELLGFAGRPTGARRNGGAVRPARDARGDGIERRGGRAAVGRADCVGHDQTPQDVPLFSSIWCAKTWLRT